MSGYSLGLCLVREVFLNAPARYIKIQAAAVSRVIVPL